MNTPRLQNDNFRKNTLTVLLSVHVPMHSLNAVYAVYALYAVYAVYAGMSKIRAKFWQKSRSYSRQI